MRYFFLMLMLFMSTGCHEHYNTLLATGKLPPMFFHTSSKESMDRFEFDTQRFSFKFPTSKVSDFTKRGGWTGMSHRDGHTIAFSFKDGVGYHISISTNHKADDMREDEYQYLQMNEAYFKKKYPRRVMRDGMIHSIDRHLEQHGKENYICDVSEALEKKWNRKLINYECYKINKQKGKYRSVTITLTYSKPINPILAQEYTYEDLKERAKRMLDSLVIKGDW